MILLNHDNVLNASAALVIIARYSLTNYVIIITWIL